ncbi:MAG TPA: hypothetical protein VLE96_02940 [Chlamydiales bacterium]|nr:hypothetical protein [Chlamydiales bacterium]
MTINAIRGIVHGSCAASLTDINDLQCTGTALKVNHLLLTTAQTSAAAGNPITALGLLAASSYVLTPVAMLADSRNVVSFSEKTMQNLNIAYQTGIVANCVAMLVLGNPIYAVASLSVLVLNAIATGQIKNVFDCVKKACSAITLASFASQILAEKGVLASLASCSAVLVGVKGLLSLLESAPKELIEKPPVVEGVLAQVDVKETEKVVVPDPIVGEKAEWFFFKPMFT